MDKPLRGSANSRRLVFSLVFLGLLLSVFFGFGAIRSMVRIAATGLESGTSDTDAIRGWMTVPYIAKVFDLPSEEIYEYVGLPRAGSDKKSLQDLNKKHFPGQRAYVLSKVKEAVRARQGTSAAPPEKKP